MKNKLFLSIGLMMSLTAMTEAKPKGSFEEIANYLRRLPERAAEYVSSGEALCDAERHFSEFCETSEVVLPIIWVKVKEACGESWSAREELKKKRAEENPAGRQCSGKQEVRLPKKPLGNDSELADLDAKPDASVLQKPIAAELAAKKGVATEEDQPSKPTPADSDSGE